MRSMLAIIIAVAFIGCSRYDYTERRAEGIAQPVRVDRISGQTEVLTTRGWKPLVRPVNRISAPSPGVLSPECKAARRGNPYADLLADIPCDAKELAQTPVSLAATPR